MKIGSYNVFEISSRVEATKIGSYNTFEQKSVIEENCEIGEFCRFGAASKIPASNKQSLILDSKIENYTMVHYPFQRLVDTNFDVESQK